MDLFKSYRIVDGKPRCVIVDENGKIVNKNPNLKGVLYKGFRWYDKYRVDEKPYNDAYHNLNKYDSNGIRI